MTPGIFDSIRQQPKGANGEIQLTDCVAGLLYTEGVLALRYEGTRYDSGRREGYIQATIEMALRDPSLVHVVRHSLALLGFKFLSHFSLRFLVFYLIFENFFEATSYAPKAFLPCAF